MNMRDMFHISVINVDNYPFVIGNIYEFKYMEEVIVSMFLGISKINGDYLFFSKLNNKAHGIQYFSYDRVFMSHVNIASPLREYTEYGTSSVDIIEKDKLKFISQYREYIINSLL